MNTLRVLQDLQQELNDYCDPNKKVSEMVGRFIDIELSLEVKAKEFREQMVYEVEQVASSECD